MMKLFHTPASHFVRKCTVTIKELGLEDRVEIVTTKWPHSWGTEWQITGRFIDWPA